PTSALRSARCPAGSRGASRTHRATCPVASETHPPWGSSATSSVRQRTTSVLQQRRARVLIVLLLHPVEDHEAQLSPAVPPARSARSPRPRSATPPPP